MDGGLGLLNGPSFHSKLKNCHDYDDYSEHRFFDIDLFLIIGLDTNKLS